MGCGGGSFDPFKSIGDTFSGVGHVFEDVGRTVGKSFEAIIKNPLPTIETIALTAAGVPYPIASAAVSAANGGDIGQIALSAAAAYAGSYVGGQLGGAVEFGTDPFSQQTTQLIAQNSGVANPSLIAQIVSGSSGSALAAAASGKNFDQVLMAGVSGAISGAVNNQIMGMTDSSGNPLFKQGGIDSQLAVNATNAAAKAIMSGRSVTDAIAQASAITLGQFGAVSAYNGAKNTLTDLRNQFNEVQTQYNNARTEYNNFTSGNSSYAKNPDYQANTNEDGNVVSYTKLGPPQQVAAGYDADGNYVPAHTERKPITDADGNPVTVTQDTLVAQAKELENKATTISNQAQPVINQMTDLSNQYDNYAAQQKTIDDQYAITEAYRTNLGRAPDPGGLDYWTKQMASGASLDDITNGIKNSTEATDYAKKMAEDVVAFLTGSGNVNAKEITNPDPTNPNYVQSFYKKFYNDDGTSSWVVALPDGKGGYSILPMLPVFGGQKPIEGQGTGDYYDIGNVNSATGMPTPVDPNVIKNDVTGITTDNTGTSGTVTSDTGTSGTITSDTGTSGTITSDTGTSGTITSDTGTSGTVTGTSGFSTGETDASSLILGDTTKTGTSGFSGTSGTVTGDSGYSGSDFGFSGGSGYSGTSGTDGSGYSGTSGTGGGGSGYSGTSGTGGGGSGYSGDGSGYSGDGSGYSGDGSGYSGDGSGYSGTTGTSGIKLPITGTSGVTLPTTGTVSSLSNYGSAQQPIQSIYNLTPGVTQANENYELAGVVHLATGGSAVAATQNDPFGLSKYSGISDSSSPFVGSDEKMPKLTPGVTKKNIDYSLPGYIVKKADGGIINHQPQFFSEGGLGTLENRYVKGDGDGTSDEVPAMLANGEFVIPADVVSKLGNGSNDAGAEVLDNFLAVIRAHVQKHDPKKLPPDSKGPLAYLLEAKKRA